MGNYPERGRARFSPKTGPTELVAPKSAFQPDSSGGYGVPSVTGDRHDQVANEAPEWFRLVVSAICESESSQRLVARQIGAAGKYRFWTVPAGISSAKELFAAADAMCAAHKDACAAYVAKARADENAANLAFRLSRIALLHERVARRTDDVIVIEERQETGTLVIMDGDNRTWELSTFYPDKEVIL